MGFLTQDVEDVLPETVAEQGTGYKETADAAFTPVFVEAVKELAETVEEQAETIEDQRDRVARLESRLADLEAEVRDWEE